MVPRATKPIGSAVDVIIYSDASTTEGGSAAVAFLTNPSGEFTVLLMGAAEAELINWVAALGQPRLAQPSRDTNEIFGLETFVMVALGSQLRGKRTALFLDNNAAAGGSIEASSSWNGRRRGLTRRAIPAETRHDFGYQGRREIWPRFTWSGVSWRVFGDE